MNTTIDITYTYTIQYLYNKYSFNEHVWVGVCVIHIMYVF